MGNVVHAEIQSVSVFLHSFISAVCLIVVIVDGETTSERTNTHASLRIYVMNFLTLFHTPSLFTASASVSSTHDGARGRKASCALHGRAAGDQIQIYEVRLATPQRPHLDNQLPSSQGFRSSETAGVERQQREGYQF